MEATMPIVTDLEAMAQVAEQGIVSKSIVENAHHKIVHFTFAPGQELSEHTASVPAVIHILRGEGVVILDGVEYEAGRASCTTCRRGGPCAPPAARGAMGSARRVPPPARPAPNRRRRVLPVERHRSPTWGWWRRPRRSAPGGVRPAAAAGAGSGAEHGTQEHRRPAGLHGVLETSRHVVQLARAGLVLHAVEDHDALAAQDVDHRGHTRRVLAELLARGEGEVDDLVMSVLDDRLADDALLGDLSHRFEVGDDRHSGFHAGLPRS